MKIKFLLYIIAILGVSHAYASIENLDFNSALQEIMKKDTGLQIQETRLKQTQAQNISTYFAFFPSLSLERDQYYYKDRYYPRQNNQHFGLNSDWNLFHGGSDIMAWKAANAEEERDQFLTKKQTIESEENASSLILNVIQQRKLVEIAKKQFESEQVLHGIAKLRYDKGQLPLQEVQKIYIDLENAQARLKDIQIQEIAASASLNSALGHIQIKEEWPWQQPFLTKKTKLDAEEFNLTDIPNWQAAEANYQAESKRAKQNLLLMLPRADISAGYNFQSTNSTTQEWAGTLTFSLPIFDRLVNYSKYSSQVEISSIAEIEKEQTRRNAEEAWLTARDSFRTNLSTALSRNTVLNIAKDLYHANELRFKSGRLNANDLSIEQARLYQSEQFAIAGWYQVHIAYIKLCHALGRTLQSCTI